MSYIATKIYTKKKTIPFNFSEKHKDYIRNCVKSTYNIAEGAVRAGKTIDNVYAFAHELKTTPDKIHLATGSTAANAKLNIGDANGFGLEYIFRGQCRWGKYKGNECLIVKGPSTGFKTKVVIFAGAALANSFKKIRGNSYGMWIGTEINLHHDDTIKEAFNRTLAARNRKFFWDLNPDNPNASIYVDYIDKYRKKAETGELLGGMNYEHFTIFDNINISEQRRNEFISQYEKGSLWYLRDIEGKRCIAEGLINRALAREYADEREQQPHYIPQRYAAQQDYEKLVLGVDFGGTGSGHAFSACGITHGYEKLIALASERHIDSEEADIDPEELGNLLVKFVREITKRYGVIDEINCDSAEPVLIRGLKKSLADAGYGNIRVRNARKDYINNRIFAFSLMYAQNRFFYTEECDTLLKALTTAVWNPKNIEKERLDNGTSDIDSCDAFEYCWERYIKDMLPTFAFETMEG